MGDFNDAVQSSEFAKKVADAVVEVMKAVGDTIRDLGEVPEGELYSVLMAKGCNMLTFDAVIDSLVRAKLVTNSNHLLKWVGPPRPDRRRGA